MQEQPLLPLKEDFSKSNTLWKLLIKLALPLVTLYIYTGVVTKEGVVLAT